MFVSQLLVVKADHLVPHHSANRSYWIFPTVGFPSNSSISSIQVNLFTEQLMQHGCSMAAAQAAAMAKVDQCLQWIGFANAAHRQAIRDEAGLDSLADFIDVTITNIRDMAESFAKHSQAQCFIFGMQQIKWLLHLMHWVQDQDRCSCPPTAADVVDDDALKEVLNVSIRRDSAALSKVDNDQVETISKVADSGKFKDECKWADWEPAFTNYLSTIPGVYGIPLSYVICENNDPQHNQDFGEAFTQEMISCASLRGANFHADSRKVHQLLKNYLVVESAEQWIHDIEHLNNG